MGLFGIDYNKPGPGVSKNAPEKKRFFVFWEIYARKFFKLVIANLLYVLISLPVITGGLAQAGLTFVTRNYVREKHVFLPADFFDTIKKNWKQALAIGILDVVLSVLFILNFWFYGQNLLLAEETSVMMIIMAAVVLMFAIITCFARYYLYLQMITFRMTVKQLIKNSFLFAFVGLKQNLLISLVLLLVYGIEAVILLFAPLELSLLILILLNVFFVPAFRSYLIQFVIFPLIKKTIIDPYYEAHPDEDVEARKGLNIETDEEPTEESVFEDRGSTVEEEPEEKESSSIPRQYTAEERRRATRLTTRQAADDDDDTI